MTEQQIKNRVEVLLNSVPEDYIKHLTEDRLFVYISRHAFFETKETPIARKHFDKIIINYKEKV